MVSEKVTIVNPSGLHLLNAVNLSNSVSRYKSSMSFTYENNGMQGTVNLKSILSIVAAGIRQGDTIEICSSGEDEEEALMCQLPKLTLQPIVENSIYHGIERKIGKGHLVIRISASEERLYIRISDDGRGMTDEKLKELNEKLRRLGDETDDPEKDGEKKQENRDETL